MENEPTPEAAPADDAVDAEFAAAAATFHAEPARRANVPALNRDRRRLGARLAWAALVVVVAGIAFAALVYRGTIVAAWPAVERYYAMMGLAAEPLGFGLSLVNVKFDQKVADGSTTLLVEGEIENVSENVRAVPTLRAALLDAEQKELQHWDFKSPVPRLLPGERVKFTTQVTDPSDGAVRLTIVFHEEK